MMGNRKKHFSCAHDIIKFITWKLLKTQSYNNKSNYLYPTITDLNAIYTCVRTVFEEAFLLVVKERI